MVSQLEALRVYRIGRKNQIQNWRVLLFLNLQDAWLPRVEKTITKKKSTNDLVRIDCTGAQLHTYLIVNNACVYAPVHASRQINAPNNKASSTLQTQ